MLGVTIILTHMVFIKKLIRYLKAYNAGFIAPKFVLKKRQHPILNRKTSAFAFHTVHLASYLTDIACICI